jgi:Ca2+:H+ antiporter
LHHPLIHIIISVTAGGLLNATCGNVPELIIALFALHKEKLEILKWSLLGSILSNLLLVLGSSLLLGGLVNAGKEHPFDRVRMQLHSTMYK